MAGPALLERFREIPDSNVGISLIPSYGTQVQATGMSQLLNVDLVAYWEVFFRILQTYTYGGTQTLSPWFPYSYIGQITWPYQSGNLKMFDGDGHALWLMNWLRPPSHVVGKWAPQGMLGDQQSLQNTLYTPPTMGRVGASSDTQAAYTMPASTNASRYFFSLRIPAGLYFDEYYDYATDANGKGVLNLYPDVFVSPLIMASTGRNILPTIIGNILNGSTFDISAFTGGTTTPSATDQGSNFDVRRTGWRAPGAGMPIPPIFNWAYTVEVSRWPINGQTQITIPYPNRGQLLASIFRFTDPSSGVGIPIPIAANAAASNGPFVSQAQLTYGSGIQKFNDDGVQALRRMREEKGSLPTAGVLAWDLFGPTRSNRPGEVINTLNTAGVQAQFNFSSAPGASAYVSMINEWLVKVQ